MAWRFAVAKPTFGVLEGCNLELASVGSGSDVRQRQPQAEGLVRPSVAWRCGVGTFRPSLARSRFRLLGGRTAIIWSMVFRCGAGTVLETWRLQFEGLEAAI